MEHSIVCCAVIVNHGLVLVVNRGKAISHAGTWEFPGGKPREGETMETSVVRRVHEELDINIEVVGSIEPYVETALSGKEIEMHAFYARIVGGRLKLFEHQRAEWFAPSQLMQLAWPATDIPIIEDIVDRITKQGKIVV